MQGIKKTADQILDLAKEAEQYHKYKSLISSRIARLFHEYQKGRHSFLEYKKKLNEISEGKSKQDMEEYYSAYLYSIMKKMELLFSKMFYEIYEDKSWKELRIAGEKAEPERIPSPAIKAEKQPIPPVAAYHKLKKFVKAEKRKGIFTGKYSLSIIRRILGIREETFLGEETKIPKNVLRMRERMPEFAEIAPPSAIAEEAIRIRRVLERRKEIEIYKPSFVGALANMTIRKTSFYLIDTFPEFFKI